MCFLFIGMNVFTSCRDELIYNDADEYNLIGTLWECRDVMGDSEIYVTIYFMDESTLVWNDHCDDNFEMTYMYNHPDISIGMHEDDGTFEMFISGKVNNNTMALREPDEGTFVFVKKEL